MKQTLVVWIVCSLANIASAQSVEIHFADKDTGQPVACRVIPTKAPKRFPKTGSNLTSGSTILFERTATLKPSVGKFQFTATRGIEFDELNVGFDVEKSTETTFDVVFAHKTKMNELNWFSGDLGSVLPAEKLQRWATADAINLTVSFLPNTNDNAEQSRRIATLELFDKQTNAPINLIWHSHRVDLGNDNTSVVLHPLSSDQIWPVSILKCDSIPKLAIAMQDVDSAEFAIELCDVWKRDTPIALACLPIDTVQVMSHHLKVDSSTPVSEAFYNPDAKRFFDTKGLGRLVEFIHWQMLDAGFRIGPSSASHFAADGKTHLGYNRVYAWVDPLQSRTATTWWASYKNGFTTVTNGPLLRTTVDGHSPGGVKKGVGGQSITMELNIDFTVREDVDYLDVIFNGRPLYQAKLEEYARRGKLPELGYHESGWMLVRIVTAYQEGYRLAMTAPTYIEFDGKPRISRKAVQFFQAWLKAAEEEINVDANEAQAYSQVLSQAKSFWVQRSLQANAP